MAAQSKPASTAGELPPQQSSEQRRLARMVTALCAGRLLIIVAAVLLAQATPELVRSFAGGDPQVAVHGETAVVLMAPPLPSAGVSTGMQRG